MRTPLFRSGETIIEVALAIGIFGVVSVIALNLMNRGVSIAQASLEISMTRNEIDAQAEAIRYIHNSFLSERELPTEKQQYRKLWLKLTRDALDPNSPGLANFPDKIGEFNLDNCDTAYQDNSQNTSIFQTNAFVLNTRLVAPSDVDFGFIQGFFNQPQQTKNYDDLIPNIIISAKDQRSKFRPTTLYPRLIFSSSNSSTAQNSDAELLESRSGQYRAVNSAEGIWVLAVRDATKANSGSANPSPPEFFDFHIRSCWYSPNHHRPTTIGTIIRLYNPETIEEVRR